MPSIKMFSFGYHGWGNATTELVRLLDDIEGTRGFCTPVFVDARARRAVRAAGFNGDAFGKLVGPKRYRWMKGLGNKATLDRSLEEMQLFDPSAVEELLSLALELNEQCRRVIFFCGCPWARFDDRVACHRTMVTTHLLAAAKKRRVKLTVAEWPGARPRRFGVTVPREVFRAGLSGSSTLPIQNRRPAVDELGPAWGSIATVRHADQSVHRVVGPATYRAGKWAIPILRWFSDPAVTFPHYREESERYLKTNGYDARVAGP